MLFQQQSKALPRLRIQAGRHLLKAKHLTSTWPVPECPLSHEPLIQTMNLLEQHLLLGVMTVDGVEIKVYQRPPALKQLSLQSTKLSRACNDQLGDGLGLRFHGSRVYIELVGFFVVLLVRLLLTLVSGFRAGSCTLSPPLLQNPVVVFWGFASQRDPHGGNVR